MWHVPWTDKNDAVDWQAYFHLRNRLVVSALHWDAPVRGLLMSSIKATLKQRLVISLSVNDRNKSRPRRGHNTPG